MSGDFKAMVEILLERKPEISAEEIKNLVDEKKRKIGAGYLTDQGALFLRSGLIWVFHLSETSLVSKN